MVNIKCEGIKDSILLQDLVPFQGDLKKRTDDDVADLIQSIVAEGLLMPFVVWRKDKQNFLLDGHGRLQALRNIPDTERQKFPVLFIDADSEEDARKALLQITSSYGKVTKKGAVQFTATIKGYKAPAVNKLLYRTVKPKQLPKLPDPSMVVALSDGDVIIKLAVPADKETVLKDLLKNIEYVKVL